LPFSRLNEDEQDALYDTYVNFKEDLQTIAELVSWRNIDELLQFHSAVAKRIGVKAENLEKAFR
jgi:phosphoenolpyruvate carboxylase